MTVSPLFLRDRRFVMELMDRDAPRMTHCPFCTAIFPPPAPKTSVAEIGKDYRDHLAHAHPARLRDLRTTRWRDGTFIRCEPWQPGPRRLRTRREPRGNHGFESLTRIGGGPPESDDESLVVVCRCGWTGLRVHGRQPAMRDLQVHYRADYRLACPFCGWYWEDQEREHAERQMAQHIGTAHPENFPWSA